MHKKALQTRNRHIAYFIKKISDVQLWLEVLQKPFSTHESNLYHFYINLESGSTLQQYDFSKTRAYKKNEIGMENSQRFQ